MPNTKQQNDTSKRGFAAMDEEQQREIAAKGGRASHASANHQSANHQTSAPSGRSSQERDESGQFTSEGAHEAARRGGQKSHR
ncbi:MAG: KGG domain-containing protein [Vampirovibrionales bacterium]|nr:KGG domain-containing protein [Vampirovibrionales bacterium]